MQCFFNKFIPKSSHKYVIIRPIGKTFISGLAYEYDEDYPK